MSHLAEALRRLESWGAQRDWLGPDPYEGLNATRPALLKRTVLGRRVLTQAVKRSPFDLRLLLGIPPTPNPAALGHVASAYALGEFLPAEERDAKLRRTLERLLELRCDRYAGLSWGYPFDVQTRVFFYPRGDPNTIATAFAGGALIDAFERTGDGRWRSAATDVASYFVEEVPQTQAAGGAFFGYLAGDRTPIHNANMLVCALLARLARLLSRPDLAERAAAGVAFTVAHQRPDGSWPYGEGDGLGWVDSFHTGYVLESLIRSLDAGIDSGIAPALERGLRYYHEALFLPDGAPKYMPDSLYPIDTQCVAQAIQTFALAAPRHPEYAGAAQLAFRYGMRRMLRGDGAYVFQRRRLWVNRTPHVRWCEAPMLHALTHLSRMEGDHS
jgi:hypothetical protein